MKKRKLSGFAVAAVLMTALTACGGSKPKEEPKQTEELSKKDAGALFEQAVEDSVFADQDEIMDLVSLTHEDAMVTWDDQDRVLLVTWHNYPDSYPEGETVTLEWGDVWTFTDKEIASRYEKELAYGDEPEMALKHLIGFPPESEHSTVTGFWVNPEDVVRPACQPDPTDGSMTTSLEEGADEDFKEWFDNNILSSYFYGNYPWTRLGYTYNWGGHGTEYGLTELLVKQGSQVEVDFTETTEEFLERIQ